MKKIKEGTTIVVMFFSAAILNNFAPAWLTGTVGLLGLLILVAQKVYDEIQETQRPYGVVYRMKN